MSNAQDFKLNDLISVAVKGKKITGRLVGIDIYSLESFDGKKFGWPSYTLSSDRKDVFKRYWFVRWGKAQWILWLKANRLAVPAHAELLASKSGIAKIEFEGDAGVSTPVAALVQYKVRDGYFCAERFAGSDAMFFSGHKIGKPKIEL
ncbi:MAG: hypothetical protein PHW76_03455 [Alphaproteobacteria bacterium]|nr:hypothetical protein [Alphaproteobacteria bacterium]